MVGVARVTLLDEDRVLGLGRLRGDELVEGGGGLGGERVVAHQRDVLDRVRHAVELAVVHEAVHGGLGEVAHLVAELDRLHDAVGDELADPVVGADDEVGALTGRGLGHEVGLDVAGRLLHDVEGDAGGRDEVLAQRLEVVDAGLVDPDGQRAGGRGSGLGGGGAAGAAAGGEAQGHASGEH